LPQTEELSSNHTFVSKPLALHLDLQCCYIKLIKIYKKKDPTLEENKDKLNALNLIEATNPKLIQIMTVDNDEEAKKEFEQKIDWNELLTQSYKSKKVHAKFSLIKTKSALSVLRGKEVVSVLTNQHMIGISIAMLLMPIQKMENMLLFLRRKTLTN
jgi:hypothetical protein